jgi:capsular polysaccharide biosynthesis protein
MAQVQNELQNLQAKVAASPAALQRYNELQAELNLAKEAYDAESKIRDKSETAVSLEQHRAGETLDLLETADLPEAPVEPNRWAIVGLGTFIGLLAGFAMAGAKELKNTSLKNLKDVRAYTNLPVLSSVPLLENALLIRRKRRLAWLAWSSALVIGGILMSGAAYYWSTGRSGPS